MQEKSPTPRFEDFALEEDVVANLHLNHDKVLSGQIPASEQLLMEIQKDLSKLECYPVYKEYALGNLPTLEMLTESMRRATDDIEQLVSEDKLKGRADTELTDELRIKNLLAGRMSSIRRNIGAYIQSVIHFHRTKKNFNGDPKAFERADHNRRRAHEGLLQSLTVMTHTVKEAQEEGLLADKKVIEWLHGMEAKNASEKPDTVLIFSEKTLTDRDFIKDWAIVADFDSQLQDMLAAQAASEKK